MFQAFNGHSHLVLELLSRYGDLMVPPAVGSDGRSTEKFIDARKCDGSTALHLSAQMNHVGFLEVLRLHPIDEVTHPHAIRIRCRVRWSIF